MFQSSLELSPECNCRQCRCVDKPLGVSILTRAFARVQRNRYDFISKFAKRFNPHSSFRPSAIIPPALPALANFQFQSSLELSPECNQGRGLPRCSCRWFQSSLELSPECNRPPFTNHRTGFQFQSSLELSPECNPAPSPVPAGRSGFQSSLELSPECKVEALKSKYQQGFQSSLELSPECNHRTFRCVECGEKVSILTRAFARVQPVAWWTARPVSSFNPHSSFRPSATRFSRCGRVCFECFNPHSSFRPSATAYPHQPA